MNSWNLNNSILIKKNGSSQKLAIKFKKKILYGMKIKTQIAIMKVLLRGKFRALRAYVKRTEEMHISNLTTHLKVLEQKEITPKQGVDRRNKLRAKINKIE